MWKDLSQMWAGPFYGLGSQTILKGVTELNTSIHQPQLLLAPATMMLLLEGTATSNCEARETLASFSHFCQVFVTSLRQPLVSHSYYSVHKVRASKETPTEWMTQRHWFGLPRSGDSCCDVCRGPEKLTWPCQGRQGRRLHLEIPTFLPQQGKGYMTASINKVEMVQAESDGAQDNHVAYSGGPHSSGGPRRLW